MTICQSTNVHGKLPNETRFAVPSKVHCCAKTKMCHFFQVLTLFATMTLPNYHNRLKKSKDTHYYNFYIYEISQKKQSNERKGTPAFSAMTWRSDWIPTDVPTVQPHPVCRRPWRHPGPSPHWCCDGWGWTVAQGIPPHLCSLHG